MALNIGENIKHLRCEKGVTQEHLADYCSVTYQSVSKWENNITTPDLHLIPTIAEFFGVSINRLFRAKINPDDVKILLNPEISSDQLWRFYVRNNTHEVAYGDNETLAHPLKHTPLYIGAFHEQKLVGILRVLHDGLTALIVEFGLELALQGVDENECGFLIKGDKHGVAKRMGEMMMQELTQRGIDFVSFCVVEGVEEDFFRSLGLSENPGHKEYIWDNRPGV